MVILLQYIKGWVFQKGMSILRHADIRSRQKDTTVKTSVNFRSQGLKSMFAGLKTLKAIF